MWNYVVKETRQFKGDPKMMKERIEQLSLYVDYLENSRLQQVNIRVTIVHRHINSIMYCHEQDNHDWLVGYHINFVNFYWLLVVWNSGPGFLFLHNFWCLRPATTLCALLERLAVYQPINKLYQFTLVDHTDHPVFVDLNFGDTLKATRLHAPFLYNYTPFCTLSVASYAVVHY